MPFNFLIDFCDSTFFKLLLFLCSLFLDFAQAECGLVLAVHLFSMLLSYYVRILGNMLSEAHVIDGIIHYVPAVHGGAQYAFSINTVHCLWETFYRTVTFLVYLAWAHLLAKLTQPLWGCSAKFPNQL